MDQPVNPNEARKLQVDVGLPVFNEQDKLENSVRSLHSYLTRHVDFGWRIVIVDNGSTDHTSAIAKSLRDSLCNVVCLHLPEHGKGLAMRALIQHSNSDLITYMDIDLSTNLRYIRLLVEGIICGYDICIGTRLMQGSRIRRSIKREVVSRAFNGLVRVLFRSNFSDASCGFKAIRTDVAKDLLKHIGSKSWCFDVELLLVAERNRLRIFEIPVEWIEGGQSKVNLVSTTFEYIQELLRIKATLHQKRLGQKKPQQ